MSETYSCTKEGIVAEIRTDVKNLRKDVDDLNKIYELMYSLTSNVSVLTDQMSRTTDDIKTIKSDVEEIKSTPIKQSSARSNMILDKIITTVITIIVSAMTIGLLTPVFREGLL